MINIKEAGRYSNFLKKNIDSLMFFLDDETVLYNKKEEHYKSKVLKNEEDEIKIVENQNELDLTLEDSIYLINHLIEHKTKLSMAINKAKSNMLVDWIEDGEKLPLDTAIEYSKSLRTFADKGLTDLTLNKNEEYIENGTGYLINNEGNQSEYNYEVKVVKKINYDRNIVRNLHKKILNKADLLSSEIENTMLKKVIDFEMLYDIHDTLEDIVEKYKKTIKK